MPMVYNISLGTPGNTTTNATPSTENNTFSVKPGIRSIALFAMLVNGMGAGLTAISGIAHRLVRWTTASTAGTSITPGPADSGYQAAKATAASAATSGTTRSLQTVFGCGAAGPGGWIAENPDSQIVCENAATVPSVDGLNISGTASLPFSWSAKFSE